MITPEKASVAAEAAGKSVFISAGGTVIAGITLNEWAAVVGIVATIVSAIVNFYYKSKHYRLERARLQADGVQVVD